VASQDLAEPVLVAAEQAAAKIGLQFTEAHQAAFIAWFEPIADADAKVLVDGLASHIQINGIASVMQGPIQGAVEGEVPALVTLLNGTVENGAAWVDSWLKSIAAGTAPPAAA
jgi:DNA-binding transcriptional regulator YbjK